MKLYITCIDCHKKTLVPSRNAQSRQLRCIDCTRKIKAEKNHKIWRNKKLSRNDAEVINIVRRTHAISLAENEEWVKRNLVSGIDQTDELSSDKDKRN